MNKEKKFTKGEPIVLIGLFLFILVALFFLFQSFVFFPKILILVLIILSAAFIGKFQSLIRDWFVFIAFVYLFDSLRGAIYLVTCKLGLPVYTLYVIITEKFLFKGIPSFLLQNWLLNPTAPGDFSWLEKLLTVIHGSHFVAFLLVGFLIWLNKPDHFRLYKLSFYYLMISGLFFYFIIPTVPPWLAANQFDLIPPLTHFNVVLFNIIIPDICNSFDTNPVAAMPSLHSAFPILCSIILWTLYRWRAVPFFLYTFLVLFAIVYTGDHYLTDILAGLILAGICFWGASKKLAGENREKTITGQPESDPSSLKRSLIIGLIIFFFGISIGRISRREYINDYKTYDLHGPRYFDFFQNQEKYKNNYAIQYYLGSHYVKKDRFRKALPHFQQSLAAAQNSIQQKMAKQQITFCTRMIQAQSRW
ncbi:MAG: phosphatase PAP2 family protein [Deltaproteobacteria bacterium]|nr:phosphatase PAP2 family protein [Deltaproteobacteria bacterium]